MAMTSRRVGAILAVLAVLAWAGPASANGRLQVVGSTGGEELAIGYQRVEVAIVNQSATTKVRQRFDNRGGSVLEGEYTFGVPRGSTVSDFAIWDGDKRVAGVMRKREDAQEIYRYIVDRKRDPGLLEQIGEDRFRAKVYPIPPRDGKRVEIEYRETLLFDSGLVAYRFPLRAVDGSAQPIRELVVTADIRDSCEIQAAWASVPNVSVHHHDKHRVTVSYEVTNVTPGEDLLIYCQIRRPTSGMKLVAHRTGDGPGTFLLSLCPPDEGLPKIPKDVVFVFDTSGSMQGARIAQARRALVYCLTTLAPEDRFGLIRFSTDVESYSESLLDASDEQVDKARAWVEKLAAMGGTDIDGALTAAFERLAGADPKRPGAGPGTPARSLAGSRPKYVVLLTDGEPTVGEVEPASVCKNARERNTTGARLFTFGVDEAAGSKLLTSLAGENRGEAISVRSQEELETQLAVFFGKLTKPLFEKVVIDWGSLGAMSVHPKEIPHFYLGRQVVVVGRYRNAASGTVVMKLQVEGRPLEYRLALSLPATEPENGFLERVWAQREVDYLLARAPSSGLPVEVRDEVIRLSIAHTFVTPYTAFIAVPESERKMLPEELQKKLDGADADVRAEAPKTEAADPNRGVSSIQDAATSGEGAKESAPGRAAAGAPREQRAVAPAPPPIFTPTAAGPAAADADAPRNSQAAPFPVAAAAPAQDTAADTGGSGGGYSFDQAGAMRRAKKASAPDGASGRSDLKGFAPAMVGEERTRDRVSNIIEKSESDSLTDAEAERYARKFQEMLGSRPRPPASGPAAGKARPQPAAAPAPEADSGMVNLTRSSVDKQARLMPTEREKLKDSTARVNGVNTPVPIESLRQLASPAGPQGPAASSGTGPSGPDPIDDRWHQLREQVVRLKARVRLVRARLAQLQTALDGRPDTQLSPAIERVEIDPPIVRGGDTARIALTVRYPTGRRPRIGFRAREGYLVTAHDAAAVWRAPIVPGTYALRVVLTPPGGQPVEETIDVEVYQPGRITYSPAHLDERLTLLKMSLAPLRAEHDALTAKLASLAGRPGTGKPAGIDLDTPAPALTGAVVPSDPGVCTLRAPAVRGTAPKVTATAGTVEAGPGEAGAWGGTWKLAGADPWPIASAEWTSLQPFGWLSSVAVAHPGASQAAIGR